MADYKKRHIAVSPQERLQLEESKASYEKKAGETDWGSFLGVATGIGLAALGVYVLAKASRQNSTTWQVTCPNSECRTVFPVVTQAPPALAQVTCPNCRAELIVDFGNVVSPSTSEQPKEVAQPGETIDMYCAHCRRQMAVTVTEGYGPQGVEYLQCPFCGGVTTFGIGEAELEA